MTHVRQHFFAVVAAAVLAALGGCKREPRGALTLNILSPHGADIRREFAEAFSAWHAAHFGQAVRIQWLDIGSGGTNNVITYLDRTKSAGERPNIDVLFGGGSETFVQFAAKKFLQPPAKIADATEQSLWAKDPLDEIPADIFGSPLHGPGNVWVGAAMSQFGMVVNKQRLAELHIDTPRTWSDLARPEFFGQLSLADPSKSGSVKTSYEMIFQQYGWEKGWAIITDLFANAAMVRDGGSNPADDVGSAEAIAGIVIDFFGRIYVTRAGLSILAFIPPEGGTTIDPDPIAVIRDCPHPVLAERFERFVLSAEGQRLWTFPPGQLGGPQKSSLGRLSVLRPLYETEASKMIDGTNPFAGKKAFEVDKAARAARGKFMGDLIKAALIDNLEELTAARKRIRAAGDPAALLEQFHAVPTFLPAQVQADQLTFSEPRALTADLQATAAANFAPPAGDPRAPFVDRIQTTQRDRWRTDFQSRYRAIGPR